MYATEGCGSYFEESASGTVTVDALGATYIGYGAGAHRVLTMAPQAGLDEQACKARLAAYIDACAMQVLAGE